jgi:type IV secretory pathway VirB2 component (pilin)
MKRIAHMVALVGSSILATAQTSWAQVTFGACCPWTAPLDAIIANITGPTVKGLAVLLVIGAGIGFAATDGGAFRKLAGLVFGLSIAFAAASWAPGFLGYTGP